MRQRRIYVASSWRNQQHRIVVAALRGLGHEVYDFQNPHPGNSGFGWRELDPDWQTWTLERYRQHLTHPVALAGFASDKLALDWCDTCVLVLPCGRSAHLELGYAAGRHKETYALLSADKFEPELMYLLATDIACSLEELADMLDPRAAKFAGAERGERRGSL